MRYFKGMLSLHYSYAPLSTDNTRSTDEKAPGSHQCDELLLPVSPVSLSRVLSVQV